MRNRLIQYHLNSAGSLKKLYTQIVKDVPLLRTLCEMEIQMPHAEQLFAFLKQQPLNHPSKEEEKQNFFLPADWENVHVVTILDDIYPKMLKNIYNPPLVLYARGALSYLNLPCISVVGTRTPSTEAYSIVQRIIQPLIQNQLCIVSGMANGVDTFAHLTADDSAGKTLAVLGGGFHCIYPKSNVELASRIAEKHLLLSEYPPHLPPRKWRFVERNRIIAGLSLATVVIEAREKSGSLITAQIALEEGREVFAVPGSILRVQSGGCNRLIQEGANLLCDGKEILAACKWLDFVH